MKNIKLVLLLASSTLFSTVSSYAAGPSSSRAVLVVAEQVDIHEISQTLTLVGKLEAQESVVISSEVSGKIDAINVHANQKVTKGQRLLQLHDDKEKAAIAEASAYLRDEQRKLAEYERLAKKGAITQTEIDAQKASVDIARARLDAVNAELKDMHITAPFDGTVGFIDFSRGQMVSAGTDLFTLDNLSSMRLDLQIPEAFLSMMSEGMKIRAQTTAWGDDVFEGEVVGIDTRINKETLNLRARIQFDNEGERLKPGMLMSAIVTFPSVQAPIIPVQALQYSGTKRYVYTIGEDKKATKTEVILGARIGNEVVIEKGLEIGQRIVVQGIVNMRDGVEVQEMGHAENTAQNGAE